MGAPAADHLDSLEAVDGHLSPLYPSTERVVERHAVEQYQGPGRATAANAAEVGALTGRVGDDAAGPAEEAE